MFTSLKKNSVTLEVHYGPMWRLLTLDICEIYKMIQNVCILVEALQKLDSLSSQDGGTEDSDSLSVMSKRGRSGDIATPNDFAFEQRAGKACK